MVRSEPYTSAFINFQGRFDDPNRMFTSINGLYEMVKNKNQCNYELIPDLFYNPTILSNFDMLYMGWNQNDKKLLNSVDLPVWAKGSPHIYTLKNWLFINDMKYSETDETTKLKKEMDIWYPLSFYYSQGIEWWIDLTFGYKQQDRDECNVFFSMSDEEEFRKIKENDITEEKIQCMAEFF